MTTRTWNNTNSSFDNAANWSPFGIPTSGDTAIIAAGTVTTNPGDVLSGLVVQLQGTSSGTPILNLVDTTIAGSTVVNGAGLGGILAINATGNVTNAGRINYGGSAADTEYLTVLASGGEAGTFHNAGTISVVNSSPLFAPTGAGQQIVNDGLIAVTNPSSGSQDAIIGLTLNGTGTIGIGTAARVEDRAGVGPGQTIQFAGANAIFQDDASGAFQGTVLGFSPTDLITLADTPFSSFTYTSSGSSGVLQLLNGGTTVARFNVAGTYSQSDFNVAFNDFHNGHSSTVISTTGSGSSGARFSFTDTQTNASGTDPGTVYSGPVNYLQYQYLWPSADSVSIAANVPNAFIHGGPGEDALQAKAGSNVLDGGPGSNFLVGSSAADGGTDTFFIDGRGAGVSWGTVVNFHHGDAVTIFGFTAGVSTLPWTPVDGAAGFQGATIHSELNGAGTGVNGSVTFAGISLADATSKFTVQNGTTGGTPYLYVAFTG